VFTSTWRVRGKFHGKSHIWAGGAWVEVEIKNLEKNQKFNFGEKIYQPSIYQVCLVISISTFFRNG
jgi:hypothetical protein